MGQEGSEARIEIHGESKEKNFREEGGGSQCLLRVGTHCMGGVVQICVHTVTAGNTEASTERESSGSRQWMKSTVLTSGKCCGIGHPLRDSNFSKVILERGQLRSGLRTTSGPI